VPVLARDGRRLADAQRCRPGKPPSRWSLIRATTAGALDRALDVAAALEVRGYGAARRPPRTSRPWSRHDLSFLASAVALLTLTVAARIAGVAFFHAYPSLRMDTGGETVLLAGLILAVALLPFADRRGIVR
jgi:energy-coupling factor transport system permease protein